MTSTENRKATKNDVAMAEAEVALARAGLDGQRLDNWSKVIRGTFRVLYIVAAIVPIYAMHWVIDPIAGKTTQVDVSVALSAIASVSLVGNGFALWRAHGQKKTINRIRARKDVLEELVLGSPGKENNDDN